MMRIVFKHAMPTGNEELGVRMTIWRCAWLQLSWALSCCPEFCMPCPQAMSTPGSFLQLRSASLNITDFTCACSII